MNKFMETAIQEAKKGILNGDGGPFGAIIVKNGKVIGKGHNKVLSKNDATCHGEMEAIRSASKKLKNFDLSGCELYTTAEPCPMCLSACLWANIEKIYYGCSTIDTEKIGFRDNKFYNLLGKNKKLDKLIQIDKKECESLFEDYKKLKNKKNY